MEQLYKVVSITPELVDDLPGDLYFTFSESEGKHVFSRFAMKYKSERYPATKILLPVEVNAEEQQKLLRSFVSNAGKAQSVGILDRWIEIVLEDYIIIKKENEGNDKGV